MADFYTTRGCETKIVKVGNMRIVLVNAPVVCPHLKESGCDIYKRRPNACRNYDGRKDITMADKCKWKELDND
jgi:Fe-S-cluster containining protein